MGVGVTGVDVYLGMWMWQRCVWDVGVAEVCLGCGCGRGVSGMWVWQRCVWDVGVAEVYLGDVGVAEVYLGVWVWQVCMDVDVCHCRSIVYQCTCRCLTRFMFVFTC